MQSLINSPLKSFKSQIANELETRSLLGAFR